MTRSGLKYVDKRIGGGAPVQPGLLMILDYRFGQGLPIPYKISHLLPFMACHCGDCTLKPAAYSAVQGHRKRAGIRGYEAEGEANRVHFWRTPLHGWHVQGNGGGAGYHESRLITLAPCMDLPAISGRYK